MFQVFLTGNNSEHFTLSPTAVQGRAIITMRVAVPLDYERIRSYSFSVSFHRAASMCVRVRERKRKRGSGQIERMEEILRHSEGHQYQFNKKVILQFSEGIHSIQSSTKGV